MDELWCLCVDSLRDDWPDILPGNNQFVNKAISGIVSEYGNQVGRLCFLSIMVHVCFS